MVFREFAVLLAAAALAACGPTAPEASLTPNRATSEQSARWTLIPATDASPTRASHTYLYAWRLDTKQGDLELCVYDPDPPSFNGKPYPQLTCSNRDEASGREQ
jgi:hypothetical protein